LFLKLVCGQQTSFQTPQLGKKAKSCGGRPSKWPVSKGNLPKTGHSGILCPCLVFGLTTREDSGY
jgi:hypothetical protein